LTYQKSPSTTGEYFTREYEHTNQLNTAYNSNTPVCAFADGRIVFPRKNFFKKFHNLLPTTTNQKVDFGEYLFIEK